MENSGNTRLGTCLSISKLHRFVRRTVFLSIHFNGGLRSPEEMLILVHEQDQSGTSEDGKKQANYSADRSLAERVLASSWQAYAEASQTVYSMSAGQNGGVQDAQLGVLSDRALGTYDGNGVLSCDIPAALIEINEMGNTNFMTKWTGDGLPGSADRALHFRDAVAEGIADAILEYLGLGCTILAQEE